MQNQSTDSILKNISSLDGIAGKQIRAARENLIAAGASAIPHLVQAATSHKNAEVRRRSIEVLGEIGSDAVPALIDLARQPDVQVRKVAIDALGVTRDQRALPVIQQALEDNSEPVRAMARAALREFGINPQPQAAPAKSAPAPSMPIPEYIPVSAVPGVSAPVRVNNGFQLVSWYFFSRDKFEEFKNTEGVDSVRKAVSLPISLMVWLPLAVPVVAKFFGILNLFDGLLLSLLLYLSVLVGWLITWRLGRHTVASSPPGGQLTISSANTAMTSIGFILLLVIAGYLSFAEMGFIFGILAQLGARTGLLIVTMFLFSLATSIGVSIDLGIGVPALIPAVAGAIIGFFIPAELNIEYVPIVFWGFCIVAGAVVAALPALLVVRLLSRSRGTAVRQVILSLSVIFNLAFIWVMLFEGWVVLYEILG